MITIRSLNKDSVAEEDVPAIRKEAQEEIALDLYNNALRLQIQCSYQESKSILQKLLDENIPQLEKQGGLPKTMSTLKYSCYYNLGNIAAKEDDNKSALDNYLCAAELDTNNVTLWHKIGTLALKLDKFRRAIHAFMQGLKCNEAHWPCLDKLIMLLFVIRDNIACLFYIAKAFRINREYVRGHVLRKQIYDSNPAAEEYFRLHNPELFADSNFYVIISEDDEKWCLEDVDKLLNRVNALDDLLKTKPLPRISLPKPLQKCTWMSLGDSLIDLHKYISNEKMSHFCQIDLSQNTNQNHEPESSSALGDFAAAEKVAENIEDAQETSVKSDLLENVERRMSVNSENNTDENFTSSQAEDNDEMDQDTEDPEENLEQKVEKKQTKRRRRDLLLDLQVWGWHSKRIKTSNKKNKVHHDFSLEGALRRTIPAHLLLNGLMSEPHSNIEDSMNTLDMYQGTVKEYASCLPLIESPSSNMNVEDYFGSQQEKDDVAKFWNKPRACCDAVTLIEEYINALASRWYLKWPEKLPDMYVEAYYMYREHFEHPPLFHSNIPFEQLKNDALATLLFGEFYHYRNISVKGDPIHPTSLVFLQLISAWDEKWKENYISFSIRVHWLRAHFYRRESEINMAIQSLHMVRRVLSDHSNYYLKFQNYTKYPCITLELMEKLLKHLEMVESISRLEHLYNTENFSDVAEIVKTTFLCIGSPATSGRIGRPAQLGMLMDALWYIDKKECFIWTERCLHEVVGHFVKNSKTDNKWDLVLDKCVQILREILKEETVCIVDSLAPEHRSRLIEDLCTIVCYQVKSESAQSISSSVITPWIVLHYVLLREEQRSQASKCISRRKRRYAKNNYEHSKEVPSYIGVLFVAHEFLGPKAQCLTSQGELLYFIVDTVMDRLDMPFFERMREKIDIHLEQAFFCLYTHFSKKNKASRHLVDHNVSPLPLTWERAQQLYDFYYPSREALPEFDSFKSLSISSDLEQLLQRIIALVPPECDPVPFTSKVSDFVNGNALELPDSIEFPFKMSTAYYLLGDYYLKQNEVARSMKYFFADICINQLRLDTWADLALGIASQVESELNQCERFKTENGFFEKAKSAEICFKRALSLTETHITLWIEFGTFQYMAHSYCSRVLKYESDTFSMDKFETLENKKEEYLNSAGVCFTNGLDLYRSDQSEADERWLHHYMLGKVAEKRRKEPVDYLEHYLIAAELLDENSAQYPDKISYYNPQHLSIEALEIHYRIHACILKFLELHEGKPISNSVGIIFMKCLDTTTLYETNKYVDNSPSNQEKSKDEDLKVIGQLVEHLISETEKQENDEIEKIIGAKINTNNVVEESPVTKSADTVSVSKITNKEKEASIRKSIDDDTSSTSTTSSNSSSSGPESDDSSSTSSSSSSEASPPTTTTYLTDTEVNNLLDRCIVGMEKCVQRFPQNYKALYRLVHFYFHYAVRKDVGKCKQLLLTEYKCKSGQSISGLFSDHKPNNFFNGVWRIPSSEIDRPGSLAAHMARCTTLLLQVLRQSNDHKILLDVFLQLRRIPDADKVYIRHVEREQLAEQALSLCIQALRVQIKNVTSNTAMQKLLLEIYKAYQRIQKHAPNKEGAFASILSDIYKKFVQNQIPENTNVLELAIKFCQQHKASEKLKQQQQQLQKLNTAVVLPPPAITSSPVVLPTPLSTTLSNINPVLKRPTMGRPRGRPPGSKLSSVYSKPRMSSTVSKSSSSWSKMMYNQNTVKLMLQYQNELFRQYSELTYMNRISNFTNQLASSTPTSLLNSNQLMNTVAHTSSNFNPLALNSFGQSFNQINPDLVKKLMEHSTSVSQTTAWSPRASSIETKPTYTMANFNKTPQVSSYKYNMGRVDQKLQKPRSTLIDFSSSENKKLSQPTDYVASSIASKRPNLTVIPVHTVQSISTSLQSKSLVTSAGKTLQEKLADKQKQLNKNMSLDRKGNEKGKRRVVASSQPSSSSHVKLPTFPLESGVSISQIPSTKRNQSPDRLASRDSGSKVLQKSSLPSVSVSARPAVANAHKSTNKPIHEFSNDDVIIID